MEKLFSIVVPLMNEEDNIVPLLSNIHKSLVGFEYEIILVDDGSTDKTVQRIKEANDDKIKLLIFNKNYGQTIAMSAGIKHASGECIITMDGDLQNDASDITKMLDVLESGNWDVVAGVRVNRKDGTVLRKIPSKIANKLIRKLTGVYIKDYGCTLKVFRKEIAKKMGLYGELHRFIPVLAQLEGARITQINVKHHPRIHGNSKYGLGRTFKVISDLMLMLFFQKYFKRPIHLFGPIGLLSFGTGAIINIFLFFEKIIGNDIGGRPLLMLGILLVLSGIQFITFGLMTEIMMRTYYESQDKKPYQLREIYFKPLS